VPGKGKEAILGTDCQKAWENNTSGGHGANVEFRAYGVDKNNG
jgi:hypothetical protein